MLPEIRFPYKYLAIAGMVLLPLSCSVEKNTGTTRFYHSLTARYNIYFNGLESYKSGIARIANGYKDDYAEMLRVFEFSDPATIPLCSSDMEQAIQKGSKLITLKSITAKPEIRENGREADRVQKISERKEYNEWVDDSYLLIGKARFLKHEFNEASDLLNYCITEANDPDVRTEASIWLARVYNETGKFPDAYRVLNELDAITEAPRSLKAMYFTTLGDHYIKQKQYSAAIDPLKTSLSLISGKRTKYRLTYLLAQLNEQTGNSGQAMLLYHEVIKMKPPYDVEFNARINTAGVFDINSGNPQDIKKELEKMLKDTKNENYLDQIYFALGNLAIKEGDDSNALGYYKKSAASSKENQNQKGRSYMALAEYFYEKSDFINAGKYYDSTVMFLDQKHPDYPLIKTKAQNLNALVTQLMVIQREDSLQKIASMTPEQRNAIITDIINSAIIAESEGGTPEYSDRYNLGQYYENEQRFKENIEQEGNWYFYNQTALTFGRTEFRRRWGERRLEDNWRRLNKTRVNIAQGSEIQNETEIQKTDSSATVSDFRKPEFYLRNLPMNDSLLSLSDERIANAYLNAGKAYAEKISDTGRATEFFEKLLSRYPGNDLVPEALYNLYSLNKDINNSISEIYRQRLLEKHPETEFAKILSDPDYYEKKEAELRYSGNLYQEAYNTYESGKFDATIRLCDEAVESLAQDQLVPKFMLLKAYAVARISDERSFKDELNKLIKAWPQSEESIKAAEIIAYINQKVPELKIEEEKKIAEEIFIADTSSVHIFSIIIKDPAFNINQASFDIISYNIDNYTNRNFRTEGKLVDNKYIIITVSGFRNYKEAMNYYSSFITEKLLRNQSGAEIIKFLINNTNLKVLDTRKDPDIYLLFFRENYLNEADEINKITVSAT